MMIQNLADHFPCHYRDCIYDLLKYLPNTLCVDAGAGNGDTTLKLRSASADTHVVAYEPFPGNIPLFKTSVGETSNIRLEVMALSDNKGEATFVVPQVVTGKERGWENQAGYSSVGFLASARSGGNWLKRLSSLSSLKKMFSLVISGNRPRAMRVKTDTIDNQFPGQHIDFLKLDTQGAEAAILRGCEQHFNASGIKCIYFEYEDNDDESMLELLDRQGFIIYDSFFIVYSNETTTGLRNYGLEKLATVNLSTGFTASEARLESGKNVRQCLAQLNEQSVRYHVDLIAVHRSCEKAFLQAIRNVSADRQNDKIAT